jgi:hypothetical protein
MQIAKVADDDASERVVATNLRSFERQIWILRPHAAGAQQAFQLSLALFPP